MVRGLDTFRTWFEDYSDNYIIIGGSACDAALSEAGFTARVTKDIDIVLIIEALTEDFVSQFWKFIRAAGYQRCEQEMEKRNAYRFRNPSDYTYPIQIELFCRKPDALELPSNIHITPIPVEEGLSSLSAILLNDDYYSFTLRHSSLVENVHYADVAALICLKAYAYLSNKKLKESGINIHSINIDKHKNDVFRMLPLLPPNTLIELPEAIRADMQMFAETIKDKIPHHQVLADAGFKGLSSDSLFQNLLDIFQLENAL